METNPGDPPFVLITGASGFIGTMVASALRPDHRVIGIDLEPVADWPGHTLLKADLTADADAARVFHQIHEITNGRLASVVHLAAYYDFSGEPSPLYEELTVQGTRRVCHELQAFEVGQIVFSSTILVMKPTEKGEVIDETSPLQADWDYPWSKIQAEHTLAAERGNIPAVILRIGGVYDEQTRAPTLAQQMSRIYEKDLESHLFPGDPDTGQPFLHITDVAQCIRRIVQVRERLDPVEIFLVAEPELVSYAEIQDLLGELFHGKDEWATRRIPESLAKAGAWVKDKLTKDAFIKPWMIPLADAHYPVSIERIRSKTGWWPERALRRELPRMVAAFLRDPSAWYETNGITPPAWLERVRDEPTGHPA